MATINEILGGDLTIGGLLGAEAQAQAEERARNAALLNFSLSALARSQGQPGQGRPGLGQVLAASGIPAVSAYQQSFDKTLTDALKGLQVQELLRKRQEEQAINKFLPQIYQAPTPATQEAIVSEQGTDYLTRPGTAGGINYDALRQLMLVSPERGAKIAEGLKSLQPKTSVQSIYNEQGQELKVRYNEETGEYSPLGGAKAEPFVQVDRGNVIELRRPTTGQLVGTLPKGAAPTAPSYTMTDYGVLNTKTGQVFQPTDEKGRPIVIDQSAKATEGERLSSGFYMRMADATSTFKQPITGADGKPIIKDGKEVTIEDIASRPELVPELVGAILPKWLGGQAAQQTLTSSVREQYEQAQENWITANLRKESGAVIGPEEMQKEIRKWFPVVGNSPQVIEQKRKARMVAEDSMRRNAGRALSTQQRNVSVDY